MYGLFHPNMENQPVGIKTTIQVKHGYLAGISRWENLCISTLLFESIPFWTILILGRFHLGMKVLAWYIDMNGIQNTNFIKHPYLTGIRMWNPRCRYSIDIFFVRGDHQSNIGLYLRTGLAWGANTPLFYEIGLIPDKRRVDGKPWKRWVTNLLKLSYHM